LLAPASAAAHTGQTWAQSASVNHATDVAAKPDAPATSDKAEFDLLKAQLAAQQDQIDQLRKLLEAQNTLIEGELRSHARPRRAVGADGVIQPQDPVGHRPVRDGLSTLDGLFLR
jgi:hypothetical protein